VAPVAGTQAHRCITFLRSLLPPAKQRIHQIHREKEKRTDDRESRKTKIRNAPAAAEVSYPAPLEG
jgi:hypothetical protein